MAKKLCVALLCLLVAAGLWGCGTESAFGPGITKIDLTAPENQEYLDWLEAYFMNPVPGLEWVFIEPLSTEPKTDRPEMIPFAQDDWLRSVQERYSQEEPSQEDWKTWDWNDAWELELYCSEKNGLGWDVLRARNKSTGETQYIGETFNDLGIGFTTIFTVMYIDEEYVVYNVGHHEGWSYWFYALGQEKGQYIGRWRDSGFLNEERSKWWYWEDEDGSYHLYYIDLLKLAAGDPDAKREVRIGNKYECVHGWMAERSGREVVCFVVLTWQRLGENSHTVKDTHIAFYDPLDDKVTDYLKVPTLGWWYGLVQILPDKFYSFNDNYARSYFKKGDEATWDWAEEQGIGAIDFYVIDI